MIVSSTESPIVTPLSEDKLFGLDSMGYLTVAKIERDGTRITSWRVADVRGKTCFICNHGWELTGPSVGDQALWDLIKEHVHASCLARHYALIERQDVREAFIVARIRFNGLVVEPNGYSGDPNRPWYHTDLLDHPVRIRVGWRKRVWEICVTGLPCAASAPEYERFVAAERLSEPKHWRAQRAFPLPWSEGVAKEFTAEDAKGITTDFSADQIIIHAWSNDALKDYLKRIAKIGGLAKETT